MTKIDGKDAATRKDHPIFSGCLNYFPDALLEVARLSKAGNDQHNPGQPLHWSRDKSNDHADCLVRHQLDAGKFDSDGQRHSAKVAWRALAQLQLELEAAQQPKTIQPTPFTNGAPSYMWGAPERRTGLHNRRMRLLRDVASKQGRRMSSGRRGNEPSRHLDSDYFT